MTRAQELARELAVELENAEADAVFGECILDASKTKPQAELVDAILEAEDA